MASLNRNLAYQYGLQVAKYFFPFVTLPYLTRVLGPDVYAVRVYVLSVMTFFQVVVDYGFTYRGTREVAIHSEDRRAVRMETTSIVVLRAAMSVVGLCALVILARFVPLLWQNFVYALIAYAGVVGKSMLPDFIFQGYQEMGILTKRFVVTQTVATVLIFLLVKGPQDLLWVPVSEMLASVVALAWSWFEVLFRRRLTFISVSWTTLSSIFRSSSVYFFSQVSTVLFTALTTLLIGVVIHDPAEVSYWGLTMTAVSAVQALYNPVANSLYPYIAVSRDFSRLRQFLYAGTAAAGAVAVLFALLADQIMHFLGGAEYQDGAYVMRVVAPLLLFSYPAIVLGFPVLGAIGRVTELTWTSTISALFHVVGLLVLWGGGHFTLVSVAVLRCMTELVLLVLRAVLARRLTTSQP